MKVSSGHESEVDLNVEQRQQKSPEELQLLNHIKEVNEKRLQLGYESLLLTRNGNIEEAVKKRRAGDESRRYLNKLVMRHKKLFRKNSQRDL
jgi:hypothetical protein